MSRKKILLEEASEIKCSNLLAFEPENIFYITGFWGEAIALLNGTGATLVVPRLEAGRARSVSKNCEIIESERGSDMLKSTLPGLDDGGVCTDCNDHSTSERIRRKIGEKRLVHSTEPFHQARKIKDEKEIANISRASRILDKLFAICEKKLRPKITERELQAVLLYEAMRMGAYPPSYRFTLSPLIVASGTNSSLPHAEPTSRGIRRGDLVTVDLTLRYNGYIADATRTFAIGSVEPGKKRIYEIVREAQAYGLEAVKAGTGCSSVDDVCRSYIRKEGYERHFIHSTGHGIGLEVHEPPSLSYKSREVLERNMTVTVEPGIYLPSRYGVRIEDSVLVNGRRARALNRYTKDLIVL